MLQYEQVIVLSQILDLIRFYHVEIILVFSMVFFFALFRHVFYKRLTEWIDILQKRIKPIHFTKRVLMFWSWFSNKRKKGLHYVYDFRKKK